MMRAKSFASIASCVNVVSMIQMQRKCILKVVGIACNTRFVADMSHTTSQNFNTLVYLSGVRMFVCKYVYIPPIMLRVNLTHFSFCVDQSTGYPLFFFMKFCDFSSAKVMNCCVKSGHFDV